MCLCLWLFVCSLNVVFACLSVFVYRFVVFVGLCFGLSVLFDLLCALFHLWCNCCYGVLLVYKRKSWLL